MRPAAIHAVLRLRRWLRSSEAAMIVIAIAVGALAGLATDPNGVTLTFSKTSVPTWLSVAANLVLQNGLGAVALYGGLVASRLI